MIPLTAAHHASLSFTISQSLFKLMSIDSVMSSNYLILYCLLLLSSIFPSIRVFCNESGLLQWVSSSHQVAKYWSFCISTSPSNEYSGWSPLGWTGLISVLSRGLSRVFSAIQFKSINSSALSLVYGPPLTSIHDHWKNHSLDYTDLCRQSDSSFFFFFCFF